MWRRILITCWLVLSCCGAPCLAQQGGATDLFTVWDERGRYGFIDGSGRVRIRPQFDGALPFTEGLAAVSIGDKWGFIDPSGKIVIPPSYYAASPFSDGLAAVTIETGGKTRPCGYIDRAGQFVIKPQSEFSCHDFSEGLAPVCAKSPSWDFCRRYGFINTQGKVAFMLPEGVRVEGDFKDGRALVLQERNEEVKAELADGEVITTSVRVSAHGYVDGAGDAVIPARFSDARDFSEGLAVVSAGKPRPADRRDIAGSAAESFFEEGREGSWFCINPAGEVVINKCGAPLSREEVSKRFPKFGKGFGRGFVNGLFFNKIYVGARRTQAGRKAVYGYMDREGKYVWTQLHGKNVTPPWSDMLF